jgi:hypothetical protein
MFVGDEESTPASKQGSARRSRTDEVSVPLLSIPVGGGASAAKSLSSRSRTNSITSIPMVSLGPSPTAAGANGTTQAGIMTSPMATGASGAGKVRKSWLFLSRLPCQIWRLSFTLALTCPFVPMGFLGPDSDVTIAQCCDCHVPCSMDPVLWPEVSYV